ncbi:MAG TPA: PepSY-like domain-containing protein, partial [Chitinophagaceae bacterium]|nr:PepSY-like domain-containing protein [Chitinophagaceae bacterium]
MKKIALLSLSIFLFAVSMNAQIRKIPAEVTESFKQKYGAATNVEWKDRLTSYVATFEQDGKKHDAYFDDDGTWKHTQTEIEQDELPTAVNEGFQKSKYTEWTIDRV